MSAQWLLAGILMSGLAFSLLVHAAHQDWLYATADAVLFIAYAVVAARMWKARRS